MLRVITAVILLLGAVLFLGVLSVHRARATETALPGRALMGLGGVLLGLGGLVSVGLALWPGDRSTLPAYAGLLPCLVGYGPGILLLALGLRRALPVVMADRDAARELRELKFEMKRRIVEETKELRRKVDSLRIAEKRGQQAERMQDFIYNNAPVGILQAMLAGTSFEANHELVSILGYDSLDEMREAVPDWRDLWADGGELSRMLAETRGQVAIHDREVRLLKKGGDPVWVSLYVHPIKDRDGQVFFMDCFVTDITRRRQTLESLRESEERFRTMLDFLPAGVFMVEAATHTVVSVNPTALEITGFTEQDVLGNRCSHSLCPGDCENCPVTEEENLPFHARATVLHKDGHEVPVIKNVTKVFMDGQVYYLESFLDVSEQARLEQLKEDVARITRHDLKTPLISMINAGTLLEMEDDLSPDGREAVESIAAQGNKMLRMIGMSLDLYRMETGAYVVEPEDVDVLAVVRQAVRDLADPIQARGAQVRILVDGREPEEGAVFMALGEEVPYYSACSNLLLNAVEASDPGGEIRIELNGGPEPRLAITNSGAVPEDVRDRFFEKYATSGKSKGTGLGTYSARLIVETLGGSMDMATSDADNRTTVTIHLPA